MHIRQKSNGDGVYTVVIASGDLNNHPSILQHPDLFEVVNSPPPAGCQFLIYSTEAEEV